MPTLGRKVAAKATVMNVGSGASTPELAATVFGPLPVDGWVTAFGGLVGHRGTGGQALKLGAFTVDSLGLPDRWLGEVSFTPTVELSTTGAGQIMEARQTSVGTGLANQGLPVFAGERVAVFIFSTAAVAVSRGAVAGATVLTRDGLAAVPDPFGEPTIIADAALDLYLEYAANAHPLVPYWFLRDKLSCGNHVLTPLLNPSGHYAVWGGEPAVNHDKFDTVDEAHGDELSAVDLEVASTPDGSSVVWSATLTKGELYPILDAGGLDPSYEVMASYRGPKLAPGVYYARARFGDHFGARSEWTPWLQRGGDGAWAVWVDRDSFLLDASPGTAPLDRIETTNPTEFRSLLAARSTVGATAAHLLVSRVSADVIAAVVLSEVVALTAAPGAAIVVPWNGAWPDLDPGTEFAYRVRPIHQPVAPNDDKRYVGNAPEWVRFRTNAPPTVPFDLDPDSSVGTDDFPLLTATVTDADDTPATGLGVVFRLTRPNASVVTVNATLQAGTVDVWEYQTTVAEVNATGTYTWDAQATDGIATTAFSGAATFVFAVLPVVAITAPASSLLAWFRGSDLALAGGAQITDWDDAGPNDWDATGSAGSQRPTFHLADQAASFVTGSNQFLDIPELSASDLNRTMAAVIDVGSLTDDRYIFGASANGGLGIRLVNFDGRVEIVKHGLATIGLSTGTVPTTGYQLVRGTVGATTWSIGINGTEETGVHAQTLTAALTAGLGRGAASEFFDGTMKEAVVTTALSLADAQKLDGYLAWQHGIEANLPPGHPYKSAAPPPPDVVTVGGASFNVAWTSTATQTHKRVTLVDAVTGLTAYDSTLLASATLSQTVPTDALVHGRDYTLTVESTATTGLVGSDEITVTVAFALPATPTGLSATPHTYAGESEATAVLLQWDDSAAPDFAHYRVTKQALAGDHETTEEEIATIAVIGTSEFVYGLPASGVPYRYRVQTVTTDGAGTVPSLAASVDHTLTFESLVLVAVGFGATDRAVLPYVATRDVDHPKDEQRVIPWSEDKPLVFEGQANYRAVAATIDLADPATVAADMAALRRIHTARATVCYRDDRGRKLFGTTGLRERDDELTRQTAELTVTENNHRETA